MNTTTRNIRIAVCGTGFWAGEVHAPVYAAHDRFELVGVHGRNHARAAELAAKFGGKAFSSFEEMLDATDAVSFALPPDIQAGLAVKAANAGKALMLEKPAATSASDADGLVEAVKQNGVAAMVYLPRLYSEPIQDLIRQAIDLKATEGSATFRSGALLPGSPYAGSVWRQGDHGALWDIGPHALSVLTSVLGPARRVSAANPRQSLIECVFDHVNGGRSTASLNLRDEGVEGFKEHYSFTGGQRIESGALRHDRMGFMHKAASTFADFVDEGRSDLGFSRDMVAVLEAASRSIRSGGKPVDV